jgi:hypothetical protein
MGTLYLVKSIVVFAVSFIVTLGYLILKRNKSDRFMMYTLNNIDIEIENELIEYKDSIIMYYSKGDYDNVSDKVARRNHNIRVGKDD